MRDVEPIRGRMDIGVIEPTLGSIGRELDVTEQTKRHCCEPFCAAEYFIGELICNASFFGLAAIILMQ
jgi:hypothetical protein